MLETLPVLVAKMFFFADFLTDASPCGFIDNEGARVNLINGYSPDIDTGNILSISARLDAELGCLPLGTVCSDWTSLCCPSMAQE